jgi:hypothetical protein
VTSVDLTALADALTGVFPRLDANDQRVAIAV